MFAPPRDFSADGMLYSQATYSGRLWHMIHTCGPLSWASLFSSSAEREHARRVLAHPSAFSQDAVWQAKKLRETTLHPDTKEPIPLPFRMAAHVPVNTVLLVGMLGTAHSRNWQMFWQFANNSFNAAQFYANKNRSNEVSTAQLGASYVAAVAASLGTVAACDRYARGASAGGRKAGGSCAEQGGIGGRGRAARPASAAPRAALGPQSSPLAGCVRC